MKRTMLFLIAALSVPTCVSAQGRVPFAISPFANANLSTKILAETNAHILTIENAYLSESSDKKNDPAYKLYKEGYDLILDESWEDARKKLAEVIKKYPKSDYADDAEYWSAYALRHIDKKKSIVAYEEFIKKYPSSSYYDDAVSDLNNLGSNFMVTTSGDAEVAVSPTPGKGYAYAVAPSMHQAQRQLSRVMRSMKHVSIGHPVPVPPLTFFPSEEEEKPDPETQLRMDALHALGSSKEDSTSFNALRDVAVDRSQARQLRLAAMEELADFRKHDPLPIYLEIAKNDTSEEIQGAAIDYLGMLPKDKNRSVETLIQLFDAIPANRSDQRENIFYSIAEVGNDKAVDFLAHVARTHGSYDLRSQAVYYLGSIGNERARAALYGILKGR